MVVFFEKQPSKRVRFNLQIHPAAAEVIHVQCVYTCTVYTCTLCICTVFCLLLVFLDGVKNHKNWSYSSHLSQKMTKL